MLETILHYTGIATWIIIALWLLVRLIFGKKWMLQVGSGLFLGPGLMQSAKKLKNEIKEQSITDDTLTEVAVKVFWRLTRLGLIGLIIAGIPVWLLLQQNHLIEAQNKLFQYQNEKVTQQTDLLKSQDEKLGLQNRLFESQNDLFTDQNSKIDLQSELFQDQNYLIGLQKIQIDSQISLLKGQNSRIDTQNYRINIQNNLLEADRKSSLVFLMSNILDKVDDEIKEQQKQLIAQNVPITDSTKYSLSKPLLKRIVALSRAFRPYKILENDTLSSKLVSPERGQLFIALMENDLDSLTQNTIVANGDFSNAIIGNIYLKGAHLSRASLSGADLSRAHLVEADLRGADLREANLLEADLRQAHLLEADLSRAHLAEADLSGAFLSHADLSRAILNRADLREAGLREVNLRGANLSQADLREAFLSYANLSQADFIHADLRGAFLIHADLRGTFLSGAIGLTLDQLIESASLYNCRGIDQKILEKLKDEKPCLFQPPFLNPEDWEIEYPCED